MYHRAMYTLPRCLKKSGHKDRKVFSLLAASLRDLVYANLVFGFTILMERR